ncbi:MAG: sulfotransferase [Candidatus Latescibacterota bacterium]|nr:MAG: sulfotransferase [Candidatus Latescibacterota bacterium]
MFFRKMAVNLMADIKSLTASVHPSPLFVLGNQKSGTTAVAALLAEMSGLSVTLDLKKEWYHPVIDRIKTADLSMADFVRRNKADFSRDIIKEPSLSVFYPELAAHFPYAKFAMVIRDPRDNIRSILNRLKIPGTVDDLRDEHETEITRAWELIINGRWLGLDGSNHIEMLAQRWNYITDSYLDNAQSILLLRYETFLNDKVGEMTRLAQSLGLAPKYDISHRVDFQFQPAGDRNVRWRDFFGPTNLARIERVCGEQMAKLGYEIET